jgi:hypothetical protein
LFKKYYKKNFSFSKATPAISSIAIKNTFLTDNKLDPTNVFIKCKKKKAFIA